MSRPVLAGLVGRSTDWLKKIETGVRPLNSLALLVDLARALQVDDLSELTGDQFDAPIGAWSTEFHHVVPAVRQAMVDVSFDILTSTSPPAALTAANLSHRVTRLWELWHKSPLQRSDVGGALPALIRQAHASIRATEGSSRRACYAATADLYRLVQRLLAHICEPELHSLAVERGRSFSEQADTPRSLAEAAWASAVDLCASGHHADAARLADRGAVALQRSCGDDLDQSALGVLGALQLEAAAAQALGGHEGDAYRHLESAAVIADRMPPAAWHLPSAFDRSNVEIMAVIVATNLRRNNESIRRAQQIELTGIRSLIRRSRLLLECAQAQANKQDRTGAIHSLHAAVQVSPEAVALIPWAVVLADDLAQQSSGGNSALAQQVVTTMATVR